MQHKSVKEYLKRLIKDGHRWQYLDINEEGEKPKFFFSRTQLLLLLISIIFYLLFPVNALNSTFVGYIISALSIFVGLFLTLVISVFDKFLSLKEIPKPTETDKIYLLQRKSFFKQFTSLTTYAILISLILIVLLSLTLMTDFFGKDLYNYKIINLFESANFTFRNFRRTTAFGVIILYNISVLYFLLDFILIVMYALTSIHTYMMIEYNRPKEDCDN